jgi:DNA-binding beta-propeller fold protein YncE
VARAAPDGYTLIAATLAHNINPILMADKAKYQPIKDFASISLAATVPMIAVTGYDSPMKSLQDVVAAAKAQPGAVTYGSAGHGGSAHLAAALLGNLTGTQMTHVPFKGNAPALTEVMAGRVTFMFYPMVGVADQVAQKRLRALAVTTPKRHPDFPTTPTMAELGYPGFEDYTPGIVFLAPAGTPTPVGDMLAGGEVSPDGALLAFASVGSGAHKVYIVRRSDGRMLDTAVIGQGWIGLAWTPDSRTLYVSGGTTDRLVRLSVSAEGKLGAPDPLVIPGIEKDRGWLAGLAISGGEAYVAVSASDRLLRINLSTGQSATAFVENPSMTPTREPDIAVAGASLRCSSTSSFGPSPAAR